MLEKEKGRNDVLTVSAIGSLAMISTLLFHEGLGHSGVAAILGGHSVLYPVSSVGQSNVPLSHWRVAVAAGPLANFIIGGALWLVLGCAHRLPIHFRYFLWLTTAFNLLNAAGYPCADVIMNFGDWGRLLRVANLSWLSRVGLSLLAAVLYYGFMLAVAYRGSGFLGTVQGRFLTLTPYLAAGIVVCSAAAMAPFGMRYVCIAAGSSLGTCFGLLPIHDWNRFSNKGSIAVPITRNLAWIIGSLIMTIFFIAIIGRGLRLWRYA